MNNRENEPQPEEHLVSTPLDYLGVTDESVEKFLDDRDRYDSSKQVCICGHAINKHSGYEEGLGACVTGRHWCPCLAKRPVLYANDTRYFMRKSYGLGSKHALSTGLRRLGQVGKRAYWLESPTCWHPDCPQTNNLIFPVPMDKHNHIVNEPGAINVLLCETCILNLKGVPGNEGKGWVW